jgi:hypothetical protein
VAAAGNNHHIGTITMGSTRSRRSFVAYAVIIGAVAISAACESPVEPPIQYADDTAQPAGARVVGFASAYMSLCALDAGGIALCWGKTDFDDHAPFRAEPAPVPGDGTARTTTAVIPPAATPTADAGSTSASKWRRRCPSG